MNDIRKLFAEVLDIPEPPMASTEQMLARAHRTRRRRRVKRAAIASTALLMLGIAGFRVLPDTGAAGRASTTVDTNDSADQVPASTTPAGAPTASPIASPNSTSGHPGPPLNCEESAVLSGRRLGQARAMLPVLLGKVPAAYTLPVTDKVPAPEGSTVIGVIDLKGVRVTYQNDSPRDKRCDFFLYQVYTNVYRDGMGGSVQVQIVAGNGAPDPVRGLCGQRIPVLGWDMRQGCQVVTGIDGTRATVFSCQLSREKTTKGSGTDTHYFAAVAYAGYTVVAEESTLAFVGSGSPPPLDRRVFTEQELIAVAANRDFTP